MKLDGDKLLANLNLIKKALAQDNQGMKPDSVKQTKINVRRKIRMEVIGDVIDIVKSGDYTID